MEVTNIKYSPEINFMYTVSFKRAKKYCITKEKEKTQQYSFCHINLQYGTFPLHRNNEKKNSRSGKKILKEPYELHMIQLHIWQVL